MMLPVWCQFYDATSVVSVMLPVWCQLCEGTSVAVCWLLKSAIQWGQLPTVVFTHGMAWCLVSVADTLDHVHGMAWCLVSVADTLDHVLS